MIISKFTEENLKALYHPQTDIAKGKNGQVTIIGGSSLFHGAPILALKTASRIVDMVFFASPQASVGKVAEQLKSKLGSFIWVPWEEVGEYIEKSDAILIGPGLMREPETQKITKEVLAKFPNKQWVIDAGSLQMMETKQIPKGAILTPNQKEFERLFGSRPSLEKGQELAKRYQCIIIIKGQESFVCSEKETIGVEGGNAGLTKGGTGDVLAGLTVALAAKSESFIAAAAASWLLKKAADQLYQEVGFAYNADDLAEKLPQVFGKFCH